MDLSRNTTKTPLAIAAAGIGLLVAPAAARAQQQAAPSPAAAPLRLAPGLTLQGEAWVRGEGRGSADFDAARDNDPEEGAGRLRLSLSGKLSPNATVVLQPQYAFRRVHGGVGPKRTLDDRVLLHQGFADINAGAGGRWRLGRQELVFGDQRLVGNLNWQPVGRSFDAARWTRRARNGAIVLDVFAGKLGDAPAKTQNPTLAGVYATRTLRRTGDTADLYLLYKGDKVTGRTREVWTLGTRPRFRFGRGGDATLEAAAQSGHVAGRDARAWAYAASAGYTLPGPAALRIGLERDFASGGNPDGTRAIGTFDQLFPTNHAHYGAADYVGWRNMEAWRLSARGRASARVTLSADVWAFRLADGRDFWYNAGGAPVRGAAGTPLRDATGAAGRDLGSELDLNVTAVLNAAVSLSGGYSRFWPGDFVRRTNAGAAAAAASDWAYLMTRYSF